MGYQGSLSSLHRICQCRCRSMSRVLECPYCDKSRSLSMATQLQIPVVVNGAAGKMGREVVKAVASAPDMTLLGAVDLSPECQGKDAGEVAGCGPLEVPITRDLEATLAFAAQQRDPAVLVDFTHPKSVYENIRAAMAQGLLRHVGVSR